MGSKASQTSRSLAELTMEDGVLALFLDHHTVDIGHPPILVIQLDAVGTSLQRDGLLILLEDAPVRGLHADGTCRRAIDCNSERTVLLCGSTETEHILAGFSHIDIAPLQGVAATIAQPTGKHTTVGAVARLIDSRTQRLVVGHLLIVVKESGLCLIDIAHQTLVGSQAIDAGAMSRNDYGECLLHGAQVLVFKQVAHSHLAA